MASKGLNIKEIAEYNIVDDDALDAIIRSWRSFVKEQC